MSDQAQNLRELIGKEQGIRVVTVSSGKGGVGKSTVSVNLAVTMSRLGVRVLVVDADFGLANVDIMLGVTTKYDLTHFLKGDRSLSEIIQIGHEGVRFISGGSGVKDLLNIDTDQITLLLDGLISLESPIDFIIIDTGAGINDNIVELVLASSETLIVTTPEPTAILDAYALVKTIVKRDRSHPIYALINKCDNKKEATRVQEGFIEVVGRHLGKSVSPMGLLMFDREIPQSIKRQMPITVSDPGCWTSIEIEKIARILLEMPSAKTASSLLARVFYRTLGERREQPAGLR